MAGQEQVTRTIAWDGISFAVPSPWEMAGFAFDKRVSRLELEDDYTVRLEVEWVRLKRRPELARIRKRYLTRARKRTDKSTKRTSIDGLPQGWTAECYQMAKDHRMVIAFVLLPGTHIFAFFRLYFGPEDREAPPPILRRIATSFACHEEGLVPWQVYDLSIELPASFMLLSTSFQAGLKMLQFACGRRRFYVWQAALADRVLATQSVAEWGANLLNGSKLIRGPTFRAVSQDEISARRSMAHPIGHADEIGRMCFRYDVKTGHDPATNRLFLHCFNYRRQRDLALLDGHLGPLALSARRD